MQNNNGNRRVNPENSNYYNKVNTDEIDAIRQNDVVQRQRIDARARAERLKRARRKRRITMIKAWSMLIGVVFVAIALIIFVVSAIKKATSDDKQDLPPGTVEAEIVTLADNFLKHEEVLYSSQENKLLADSNKLLKDYVTAPADKLKAPVDTSEASALLWQARRFAWYGDKTNVNVLKETLRDYPIYSNGYVWSSSDSIKHKATGGYVYDTNARYISAVGEIVLWQTEPSFLYEKDTTSNPRLDISQGMTVLDKLELATEYYFDKNDLNGGGIRYNEADGLVYILTPENSGLTGGNPSNYWDKHRLGYLDAYNNIAFNEAMVYLSQLYTVIGDDESANKYAEIAQVNKKAINDTFWNENLGRYIGAKDVNNGTRDLGYTFLNLEAVSSGIADSKKTQAILSWLDGDKKIYSDTSSGKDIYKFGFAPRTNTISAGTYWYGDEAEYGKHVQNGGASLVTAYYDLEARLKADGNEFSQRYKAVIDAYNGGKLKDSISGGEDAAFASMAVYGLFGVSTNGNTLCVQPKLGKYSGSVGIKNIGFGYNSYSFVFSKDAVLVFADSTGAVRLDIGGFEKNTNYTVSMVEDGIYTNNAPFRSDKNGHLVISKRFGENSYLVIKKAASGK